MPACCCWFGEVTPGGWETPPIMLGLCTWGLDEGLLGSPWEALPSLAVPSEPLAITGPLTPRRFLEDFFEAETQQENNAARPASPRRETFSKLFTCFYEICRNFFYLTTLHTKSKAVWLSSSNHILLSHRFSFHIPTLKLQQHFIIC